MRSARYIPAGARQAPRYDRGLLMGTRAANYSGG